MAIQKTSERSRQAKTIHYKKVILQGAKTLQDVLKDVFRKSSDYSYVGRRTEKISEDGKVRTVINGFSNEEKVFYGQLIIYEEGRSQELMRISSDAESYEIKAVSANNISGSVDDNQEFIESFLYFCVIDNDLALIQSRSLRSKDLERHLQWLIFDCTSALQDGCIILSDKPSEDIVNKVKINPAQKIRIGSPVQSNGGEPVTMEEEKIGVKYIPVGLASKVLNVLIGDGWLDRESFDTSLDEANLKLKLEIGFSRKTSKDGQLILDKISNSLRHMDSEDIEITLSDGSTIKGDEVKLSGKVTAVLNNGVIDENELKLAMFDWMIQRIANHQIESSGL